MDDTPTVFSGRPNINKLHQYLQSKTLSDPGCIDVCSPNTLDWKTVYEGKVQCPGTIKIQHGHIISVNCYINMFIIIFICATNIKIFHLWWIQYLGLQLQNDLFISDPIIVNTDFNDQIVFLKVCTSLCFTLDTVLLYSTLCYIWPHSTTLYHLSDPDLFPMKSLGKPGTFR